MKKTLLIAIVSFIAMNVMAQSETDYNKWLFVQSDKALQYRMAIVKQEGEIAYLKLQFRVNSEDAVFCKSSLCEGMLLYMSYAKAGTTETIQYNYLFDKSFQGLDKIYTMVELVPVELKTWPDGSKRSFNKVNGIVYTLPATGDKENVGGFFIACVDIRLKGKPDEHRCSRDFEATKAIVVQ